MSDEWDFHVSEALCRRFDFSEAVTQTHSMEMRSPLRRPSSQGTSLQYSQGPATVPYPNPDEFSPQLHTLFP